MSGARRFLSLALVKMGGAGVETGEGKGDGTGMWKPLSTLEQIGLKSNRRKHRNRGHSPHKQNPTSANLMGREKWDAGRRIRNTARLTGQ